MDEVSGMPAKTDQEKFVDWLREKRVFFIMVQNTIVALGRDSRGRSMIFTTAEMARSWTGKVMGAMKTEYPYPDSTNPNNLNIEPMADDTKSSFNVPSVEDEIRWIKALRKTISADCGSLLGAKHFFAIGDEGWIKLTQCYVEYHNLSIALGTRLAELREGQTLGETAKVKGESAGLLDNLLK